jgi:hypothetical protein
VLVAAGAVQVRGDDHLVVEAEHRVVQMHRVQPDLNTFDVVEGFAEVEGVADAARQGAADLLQGVTFDHVRTVRVGERQPDACPRGGLVGQPLHGVGQQLQHERIRVTKQIDPLGGTGQQRRPQRLRNVGAVCPGPDDFGSGCGTGREVGAGLWPEVGFGLAE